MSIEGLWHLPWWGYVAVTLVMTHITGTSMTLYLHRNQSHLSLDLHPAVSHFFRFWLWFTTATVTREWVAIHRKHHARCETDDDPHSPQRRGISRVLFGGALLYRAEAVNQETLRRFGHNTPGDWIERHVYQRHQWAGVGLLLALDLLLFGVVGLIVFAAQMLWVPFWAAGVVNGVGHYWGYRNFETPNASRNFCPIGLVMVGEELHNNHHAYPRSARFSCRWWEFDLGWLYVRILSAVGLARVRRSAPRTMIVPGTADAGVDRQTVRALVQNRAHVLRLYARDVIRPVVREELCAVAGARGRRLARRASKLLGREDVEMDEQSRQLLREVVGRSAAVHAVYRFKQQLKALWAPAMGTPDGQAPADPVQWLERLCRDAEGSHVRALREFAATLRGYTVAPA